MTGVIMVLLGSFGLVLVIAVVFVVIYRRHLRRLRRRNRALDQLSYIAASRRRLLAYPLPSRWVMVRTQNALHLREWLEAEPESASGWGDALSRFRERRCFVSAPVDGWVLVIGGALPDPAADVDQCYRFLLDLSVEMGEVQFFQLDRVLSFHAWAKIRDGRVLRAYAWAGETVWNEGRMTLEERLLGLRCRDYGAEHEPLRYGELSPEQGNVERVPLLARRWAVDLAAMCEILLHHEGVESGEDPEEHA